MNKLKIVLTVGGMLGLGFAEAEEVRWNNANGGDLNDAANWVVYSGNRPTEEHRLPQSGDSVYYMIETAGDCTLSEDYTMPARLNIGSTSGWGNGRVVSMALGDYTLTASINLCNGSQLILKSGRLKNLPQNVFGTNTDKTPYDGPTGRFVLDGATFSYDGSELTTYPDIEIKNNGWFTTTESKSLTVHSSETSRIIVGENGRLSPYAGKSLYIEGTVENTGGTIEGSYVVVGNSSANAKLLVNNGTVNVSKVKIGVKGENATVAISGAQSRIRATTSIEMNATATLEIDLDGCPEESLVHASQDYTFTEGCKIRIKSSNKMRRVPAFEKAILTSDHTPTWANVTIEVEEGCGLELVRASGHELVVRHKLKGMVVILK